MRYRSQRLLRARNALVTPSQPRGSQGRGIVEVSFQHRAGTILDIHPGMKRIPLFGAALLSLFAALTARSALADGSIEGRIHYVGSKTASPPVKVSRDFVANCGATQPAQDLLVGKDRGLANAVVTVVGIPGTATPTALTLDEKNCVYLPHVAAVAAGSSLVLLNSDDTLHNVHATIGEKTLANIGLPTKGQKINAPARILAKPGVVDVMCDAGHTWMSAHIHVFEHPGFAVSDADGTFKITGVPPGTYDVTIEHETLGTLTKKVTVPANGVARLEVDIP